MSTPFFDDLGKTAADFFKFKSGFTNKLTTKHTTSDGVALETTGELAATNVNGSVKAVKKGLAKIADLEFNVDTNGKLYVKSKFKKFGVAGLVVKAEGGNDKDKKTKVYGLGDKITAQYTVMDCIAGSFTTQNLVNSLAGTSKKSPELQVTATASHVGLSVGVAASILTSVPAPADKDKTTPATDYIKSFDVGVQYTSADFTGALTTSKQSIVNASVFHKVSKDYTFAAQMVFDETKGNSKVMSVGMDYAVDVDTQFKSTYATTGELNTSLQHTLANPSLKINALLKSQLTSPSLIPVTKEFGIQLTMGSL